MKYATFNNYKMIAHICQQKTFLRLQTENEIDGNSIIYNEKRLITNKGDGTSVHVCVPCMCTDESRMGCS